MREYQVKVTDHALADMEMIYTYVAECLQAPDTALKQYERIADGILSLSTFPERCRLFDSQPERDMGFRMLTIDNYAAVYVIEDSSVTVLRVLYSASDINARLREGY